MVAAGVEGFEQQRDAGGFGEGSGFGESVEDGRFHLGVGESIDEVPGADDGVGDAGGLVEVEGQPRAVEPGGTVAGVGESAAEPAIGGTDDGVDDADARVGGKTGKLRGGSLEGPVDEEHLDVVEAEFGGAGEALLKGNFPEDHFDAEREFHGGSFSGQDQGTALGSGVQ